MEIQIDVLNCMCMCLWPEWCCMQTKKINKNITNGIWIKVIRKTNQCVFDSIRYTYTFFLMLCYFYIPFRSVITYVVFFALLIPLLSRPWLWLSSYFILWFCADFLVFTKRINFKHILHFKNVWILFNRFSGNWCDDLILDVTKVKRNKINVSFLLLLFLFGTNIINCKKQYQSSRIAQSTLIYRQTNRCYSLGWWQIESDEDALA